MLSHVHVADCAQADLQPTFLAYPGWHIRQNNLQNLPGVGLSQCRASCIAVQLCRTIDLVQTSGNCYLQDVDARDVPTDWSVYADIVHYQKTCL